VLITCEFHYISRILINGHFIIIISYFINMHCHTFHSQISWIHIDIQFFSHKKCTLQLCNHVVNPWQEKMTQKCQNLLYLQSMFLFCSSCLSSCHLTSSTSSEATSVVPFSWSEYPSAQLHTWGVTEVHEQVPIATCNWPRMQSAWKWSMKTQAFWAANLFRCEVASRI
jgi:hypothetical protein